MLYTAGKYNDIDEARKRIEEVLEKGEGAAKLKEMIKAQGGDDGVVDDPDRLPGVKRILPIKADQEGCIKSIHADSVGLCALLLGAGRSTKEDTIDPGVGILLKKRVGDWVKPGDALGDFYINDEARLEDAVKQFKDAITIDSERPKERPMIYGVVTEKGIERW